jgi:hypothetical protein
MKQVAFRLLSFLALGIFTASFALAQDNRVASAVSDMYVISAKAGGVNLVEGKVAVARKNAKSGLLLKGDSVEIGERVLTGENGKAEILLNPGSFLRLDKNTSFQFISTDLENLKLVLTGGSAIFEVFANDEFPVTVRTPKAAFYLIDSGVYRINVLPDGTEQIEVWKGKAQIGDVDGTIIKGGKTGTVRNGQLAVVKFDRDDKDPFDAWSKLRAKDLAKMNASLQKRQLRDSLFNSYNQRGWNVYDSFGVWAFNSFYGSYCFVPFGYGWSSPYGYGYGRGLWNYRFPSYFYYPPSTNNNGTNAGNNNNTGSNPPVSRNLSNEERSRRLVTPPFQRMRGVETPSFGDNNNNIDSSMPSRTVAAPVFVPPANPVTRSSGTKGDN